MSNRTSTRYDIRTEEHAVLREKVGKYLADQRVARGLTQDQLADMIGKTKNSWISQVEKGKKRVPPEDWDAWAQALGLNPLLFSRFLFRHYLPTEARLIGLA